MPARYLETAAQQYLAQHMAKFLLLLAGEFSQQFSAHIFIEIPRYHHQQRFSRFARTGAGGLGRGGGIFLKYQTYDRFHMHQRLGKLLIPELSVRVGFGLADAMQIFQRQARVRQNIDD